MWFWRAEAKPNGLYLAWGWYTHCARPVVVHVCHLVCQSLHVVRLEVGLVMHNSVVGWSNCPLANMLAHQKEVITVKDKKTKQAHMTYKCNEGHCHN